MVSLIFLYIGFTLLPSVFSPSKNARSLESPNQQLVSPCRPNRAGHSVPCDLQQPLEQPLQKHKFSFTAGTVTTMDFNQEPTGPSSPSVRNAHRPAQNALGAMAGRQGPDICDHKESGLPNQDLYAKDDDDPKKLLIKLTANMARREDLNQKSIEPLTSSIQVLFQTAQVCFDAIPARRGSEAAKARSRLEQWREKAFDSADSLDIVFESSKLACQPLRQCVLIILVRMLVWGGSFRPSAIPPGYSTDLSPRTRAGRGPDEYFRF